MIQQQLDLIGGPLRPPQAPLRTPREKGEEAAEACTSKAEEVADFDREGCRKFMLGWLARWGDMSGEALTDAAKVHGFHPHDERAFGAVFGSLSRRGLIRCVGFCPRQKGHGTAGGRIWTSSK